MIKKKKLRRKRKKRKKGNDWTFSCINKNLKILKILSKIFLT